MARVINRSINPITFPSSLTRSRQGFPENLSRESQSRKRMKVSCCSLCQKYEFQGSRGGFCQQLNVNVQGFWKACPLAVTPAF